MKYNGISVDYSYSIDEKKNLHLYIDYPDTYTVEEAESKTLPTMIIENIDIIKECNEVIIENEYSETLETSLANVVLNEIEKSKDINYKKGENLLETLEHLNFDELLEDSLATAIYQNYIEDEGEQADFPSTNTALCSAYNLLGEDLDDISTKIADEEEHKKDFYLNLVSDENGYFWSDYEEGKVPFSESQLDEMINNYNDNEIEY